MPEITQEAFEAALLRLAPKEPVVKLDLGLGESVMLISLLQLALRHPGNKGACAKLGRRLIDDMIAYLGSLDQEAGEMLRMGDRPECDVP